MNTSVYPASSAPEIIAKLRVLYSYKSEEHASCVDHEFSSLSALASGLPRQHSVTCDASLFRCCSLSPHRSFLKVSSGPDCADSLSPSPFVPLAVPVPSCPLLSLVSSGEVIAASCLGASPRSLIKKEHKKQSPTKGTCGSRQPKQGPSLAGRRTGATHSVRTPKPKRMTTA